MNASISLLLSDWEPLALTINWTLRELFALEILLIGFNLLINYLRILYICEYQITGVLVLINIDTHFEKYSCEIMEAIHLVYIGFPWFLALNQLGQKQSNISIYFISIRSFREVYFRGKCQCYHS